jgi:hypothetical protein
VEFSSASSLINLTNTKERLSNATHAANMERGIFVIWKREMLVMD